VLSVGAAKVVRVATSDKSQDPVQLPTSLKVALRLLMAQTIALAALTVAVGIAAFGSTGWRSDVPVSIVGPAEVVTYALFVVGMLLTLRALSRARRGSRAPFLLIQLFAVVLGNVVRTGDGLAPLVGWIAIASGVVGIVLLFMPDSRAVLERGLSRN
jgi:hypothetical protein